MSTALSIGLLLLTTLIIQVSLAELEDKEDALNLLLKLKEGRGRQGKFFTSNQKDIIPDNQQSDENTESSGPVPGIDRTDVDTYTNPCPDLELQCSSLECIPMSYRCNGRSDCSDGSDEQDCTEATTEFQDQYTTAADDPVHTTTSRTNACPDLELQCSSLECIPMSYRCNGRSDCSDGSDEQDCTEATTEFQDQYTTAADDPVHTTTSRTNANQMTISSVTITPTVQEYYEGDRIELECEARGNLAPTIFWKRDSNRPIPITSQQIVITKFIIDNARVEDSGEYSCIASNSGSSQKIFEINIRPPDRLIVSQTAPVLKEGRSTRVVCRAFTNVPTGTIDWVRQDNGLFQSNVRSHNGVLFINRATLDNQGVYTCQTQTAKVAAVSILVTVNPVGTPPPSEESEISVPPIQLMISCKPDNVDCTSVNPLPTIRLSKMEHPCSCSNGATCNPDGSCNCPPGSTGYYCDARLPSTLVTPRRPAADMCSFRPCRNGGFCRVDYSNMMNYTCDCPLGFAGASCQMELTLYHSVGFNGNGYIELPARLINYNSKTEPAIIALAVHTTSDGVLLYQTEIRSHDYGNSPDDYGSGDFILIRIARGYVIVEWDMGSGTTSLTIDSKEGFVTDGERHTIIVKFLSDDKVELTVDGITDAVHPNDIARNIKVDSNIYIGGIPDRLNVQRYQGLVGCVEQVEMNDPRAVNLGVKAVAGRNAKRCRDPYILSTTIPTEDN